MIYLDTIFSDTIPSSFVKKSVKRSIETGHGEAKLYLNEDRSLNQYISFFNDYNQSNRYYFNRDSLIQYLNRSDIQALYYNNPSTRMFNNIDDRYHNRQLNNLSHLSTYIPLTFEERIARDSQSRYYIRSYDNIFRETFRSICLPNTTSLRIDKFEFDGSCDLNNNNTFNHGDYIYILSVT